VIVAGALLVAPKEQFGFGLSLPAATISIVIGSVLGCLLLGFGGVIGTREARPTMALFRPVLGTKGSWIPTVFNVAQLVGWTAFELWAMALVGSRLGERLFGFTSFGFWLVFFSLAVFGLSLWGPLGVVRVWMEKFGAWLLIAIAAVITVFLLVSSDLGAMWSAPGAGGLFLLGLPMDIVIALPVSWIPLVADYNRYSRSERGSFIGSSLGFLISNIWFFSLGTLLILRSPETLVNPEGIALGILSLAGVSLTGSFLLAGLVVGETDEAFADVYSAAVSLRNIFPRVDNRVFVVGVILISVGLAGRFTMLAYELFLFLLGSIFIPLIGVWLADYYFLHNRSERTRGVRLVSLTAWLAGFGVYHWIAPTPLTWWLDFTSSIFGSPLTSRFEWLGASIPSFVAAFAIQAVVGSLTSRKNEVLDEA
jgi:NCS1 family nucleobase:cation symporter-1